MGQVYPITSPSSMDREPGCPPAQGLYDPSHEKDACGVGFVVNVKGVRSHSIVKQALQLLVNLLHRGACGCEVNTGDGAGIIIQMPDKFLRKEARNLGITLPAGRPVRRGMRVPAARSVRAREPSKRSSRKSSRKKGRRCSAGAICRPTIAWSARRPSAVEPYFKQLFVGWRSDPPVYENRKRRV